jgi:hypothetical protein
MPHDFSSNSVVMTGQKSLNHWTKDAKKAEERLHQAITGR